jgi:hypothetical protein
VRYASLHFWPVGFSVVLGFKEGTLGRPVTSTKGVLYSVSHGFAGK